MIILYDIHSLLPGMAFSPNTWKTRFTLNYKGIPYKTEWIEFADIKSHGEAHSIVPKSKDRKWNIYYSLPAIWDTTTGVKMCDSLDILEYLEKTYPDRPTLFPDNTKGLHLAFQEGIMHTGFAALLPFIIPAEIPAFNPRSAEYFCRTLLEGYGIALEKMAPMGEKAAEEWAKFKGGLDMISQWYEKTDNVGPFLMGDKVGWGDIVTAAWIIWIKTIWENDSQREDIASWNEGRWVKLLDAMKPYSAIN